MPATYKRNDCRLCRSTDLVRVMDLAPTPPGNQFLTVAESAQEEETFDLYVMHCQNCTHLQLGVVVDPEILFQRDYKYVSGTSPVFVQHFKDYAAWILDEYGIAENGLVVDIGSNDGTGLRCFQDLGYRVLGIDPATEIANEATAQGIPTWAEFFNTQVAKKVCDEFGQAAFITSHNTCAHVDDLENLMRGVLLLLADDGMFVFEVGYAVDVYDNAYFDTIYHEHVDYHTVKPLVMFFDRLDMVVVDVVRVNIQGGSIRVAVRKKSNQKLQINHRVQVCLNLEKEKHFQDPNTFLEFSRRINDIGVDLRRTLNELLDSGKRIAAYGAPTKSTTLLTHFGIGRDHIEYIVDDNPKKQGLVSPIHHIPVVSHDVLDRDPPDFLLILAWNFAEPIMANNQEFAQRGGRFILPMPEVKVI